MSDWTHPTMRDELAAKKVQRDAAQAELVARRLANNAKGANDPGWEHDLPDVSLTSPVKCVCGRTRLPEDMLDVSGIPQAGGHSYLCSACVEDLHRTEVLDRVALAQAKGAPPAWIDWFRGKLRAGPLLRTGIPQDIWGEMLAAELDAANQPTQEAL